jgi:hypothetical protein
MLDLLPLPLLVARILADHIDSAATAHEFALLANSLDA